jgi:ABC-type glutathione transport system ATPase component
MASIGGTGQAPGSNNLAQPNQKTDQNYRGGRPGQPQINGVSRPGGQQPGPQQDQGYGSVQPQGSALERRRQLAVSLKRISLRDFVIVRELDLDLQDGFTILTGETGAGKSILIDALQLVTGGRADIGLIREGAQRADVSAEFECSQAIDQWLDDAGFFQDTVLLLRRTVDNQGKSRAWINGSACTATQMRALGEQLIDIHGQHAWQSLTRADAVRDLLDAYAGIETDSR